MRYTLPMLIVGTLFAGSVLGQGSARAAEQWVEALIDAGHPRTLEQKVLDADLVVRGKATLVGKEIRYEVSGFEARATRSPDPMVVYQQEVRLDVSQVLWPSSLKGITNILFRQNFLKESPAGWWAYTNTPGVFFLTRQRFPQNGAWARLDRFDDWIESTTNQSRVQAAIISLKGSGGRSLRQPEGAANGSQPIRPATDTTSEAAGSHR
jgi:hypothetical protein